MKQNKHILFILCGMMLASGTGCQNQNSPVNPQDQMVQTRHMTIKMNDATIAHLRRITHATITDDGTSLSAEWVAGDEATYCNLSRTNGINPLTEEYDIYSGALSAATSGTGTDLNGDVTCSSGDYLAVVYPHTNSFVYNDPGTSYTYTLPLTGQDGSLARLASTYHYIYGRAFVQSVDGTTATATMDKMVSLLTVCKFSFTDGANPIPVGILSISYGGSGSYAGKYPQSATVTVTNLTANNQATAEGVLPDTATPLTITCASEQNEVYVALLPEVASRTYTFTVTNSTGTYTGTASAQLNKGEYVVATNLQLSSNG